MTLYLRLGRSPARYLKPGTSVGCPDTEVVCSHHPHFLLVHRADHQLNPKADPGACPGLEGQPLTLASPPCPWQLFSAELWCPRRSGLPLSSPSYKASTSQSPVLGQQVLSPPLEPTGAPWPSTFTHGHELGLVSDVL